MNSTQAQPSALRNTHAWVRPISIAILPGPNVPATEQFVQALQEWFLTHGCTITTEPNNTTDLVLTTTHLAEPVEKETALLINVKRRYGLKHRPTLLTIVGITEAEYAHWLAHFDELRQRPDNAPLDYSFPYPGLGTYAVDVLDRQARRGGPEVAMGRFLQGFSVSFRVLALRYAAATDQILHATHFDLAGAHPTTHATDWDAFVADAALRMLAATCTQEVNHHVFAETALASSDWDALQTPLAMTAVGPTFTEYGFFTDPVSVEKLLGYRGLSDAISAHYSEGCYAAWDADLGALISTASGSSRLVDKRTITRRDQAVIVDIKPDGSGAVVQPVDGLDRVVPSVEAVELMTICQRVPKFDWQRSDGSPTQVPIVRALLHGHLTVESYDPAYVEALNLPEVYYRHLVSCGTGALAAGTSAAFATAESLLNPADPRQIVFLIQPGHGIMMAEKWVAGQPPFGLLQQALAAGKVVVSLDVPQGEFNWQPQGGHLVLVRPK